VLILFACLHVITIVPLVRIKIIIIIIIIIIINSIRTTKSALQLERNRSNNDIMTVA